jgi:hypothetical protein
MARIFLAKPVAARLLGTIALQWLDSQQNCCSGSSATMLFSELCLPGKEPVRLQASDHRSGTHRGGRTVAILQFSDV